MPRDDMAVSTVGIPTLTANCCMGAPRGNDFLFAPLGAGSRRKKEIPGRR